MQNINPNLVNGLNLYAYCNNNPIAYSDPNGNSIIGTIIIICLLFAGTAIGAGVAGKKAYDNGARGWELVGQILIGATIGLAVAGVVVMLGGAGAAAIGQLGITAGTFFGLEAMKAVSLGALAWNFAAFVVAPIAGFDMDGVDLNPPPEKPIPTSPPITASSEQNKLIGIKSIRKSIPIF